MKRLLAICFCLTLVFTAAACSDDDGGTVKSEGESSGSGSGSGSASGSGSGSGSAVAGEEKPCAPVGTELEGEADTTVEVEVTDHEFDPAIAEVPAGVVTFEVTNNGSENHELAFLPGGDEVPVVDGAPDEDALAEAGAFELEAFGPGLTCNATYDLEPGTYTMFCIVEAADGETHYDKGMKGELTVT